VLQSVLPGILQGDKSDSLLYGSVDNGKKISWNEDFHAKVRRVRKFNLVMQLDDRNQQRT
jgi:protein TIF31